jgi:hypothetical protein
MGKSTRQMRYAQHRRDIQETKPITEDISKVGFILKEIRYSSLPNKRTKIQSQGIMLCLPLWPESIGSSTPSYIVISNGDYFSLSILSHLFEFPDLFSETRLDKF